MIRALPSKRTGGAMALLILLIVTACGAGCSSSGPGGEVSLRPGANPFGIRPSGEGFAASEGITLAGELGVRTYRPHDLFLETWSGQNQELQELSISGLDLVLSVRNKQSAPSSPPPDLEKYRQSLSGVLDLYPPKLLLVENEEDSPGSWSGTPEQYGVELAAAREVAHARGIKCANGGLSSDMVVLLTWDHYRETGREAEAEGFLSRAASPGQLEMIKTDDGKARALYSVKQGKRFLQQYRKAGVDFVNFHWHSPDPAALGETVGFLRETTGLQAVCCDMGVNDTLPETVTSLLEESLRLGLPLVIWSSIDRDAGQAFQAFMRDTF